MQSESKNKLPEKFYITTDCIIVRDNRKEVLLIKRKNNPFKDYWALPGGFLDTNETLEQSVAREIKEETNIDLEKYKQFRTYSTPNRDPRGRTITTVFYSFLTREVTPKPDTDSKECKWFTLDSLPELAFDHSNILNEFRLCVMRNESGGRG